MDEKKCVVCNEPIYSPEDQPDLCAECSICPSCGSDSTLICSPSFGIFECSLCKKSFDSKEDMEMDVTEYWIKRAKKILRYW